MQKPPVLQADMQKCHEKGSREAPGSGIRSDSLFPTVCLHRFRSKRKPKGKAILRPQCPQVFGDKLWRYPSTCVVFCQHSEAAGRYLVSCTRAHQNHNSGFLLILRVNQEEGSAQSWSAIMENFVGADHRKTEQKIHTYRCCVSDWCWLAHPITTVIIPTVSFF